MRAGNIRAYAVTDNKRVESAPDIPTTDEAGLPGFHMTLWSGLWVPKDTPKDIVAKLNAAAVEALNDPAVRKQLENLGPADAAEGQAHAGGARRLAEGRNRKMVADDQGRQRQGGLTGRNRTTAFPKSLLTGHAISAPMNGTGISGDTNFVIAGCDSTRML